MVLHFERRLAHHTAANIFMIYHPLVPDNLASVATSPLRNLDATWGNQQ
jgi:hypothetical protein